MAKKTTAKTAEFVDDPNVGTEVILASTPRSLIEDVDSGHAGLIPLPRLIPFYVQADRVKKRLEELMKKAKEGILPRRDEGRVSGDRGQHRVFEFDTLMGRCELTVQEKRSWKPNEEKLVELLHRKKLWDAATNLRVTTSGDAFQKFLRAHRKELKDMGVEIVEELDFSKVDGLCQAKLITTEELEAILDKPEPTYALIPRLRGGFPSGLK
jgi:hypothetical protein